MPRRLGRRMFLRGATGFTLAIPFLPSLVEDEAEAAPTDGARFIALGTEHGAIWQDHMFPNEALLTNTMDYAGHQIRRGSLALDTADGESQLSYVMRASSSRLTSALVQKMNVLRGLDVPFYIGHHRGGHLGNYAENDGNGGDGGTVGESPMPTIDQILAWSSSFYPDLTTILERSLVMGGGGMSAGWSSPSTQSGEVNVITPESDSLSLFNRIFVPDEDPMETRAPIVDRVMEDYRRLRDGNRRLSAADRQRLNDHLDRLDELQRKLNVTVSCGDVAPPTTSNQDLWHSGFGSDPQSQVQYWQMLNDVMVAAMVCDTCRIATMRCNHTFSDYTGDWHQDIAHQANNQTWANPPSTSGPHPHQYLVDGNQTFFEHVFLDLVEKLDAVDLGNGQSLLDTTLVQWTQESGPVTHDSIESAVVTAGSANGWYATGQYCDYRNLQSPGHTAGTDSIVSTHTGLVYNQYLGTVLQSMGLDPSEYEVGGNGGYGQLFLSTEGWFAGYEKYGSSILSAMGQPLPFLPA